jgi:hypothetical protein
MALCPSDITALYSLRADSKPVQVTYRLDGSGQATVTYTKGDDDFAQQRVTAPWSLTVDAETDGVFSILATPSDSASAQLTCSIRIADRELDREPGDPADGGLAACSVTAGAARQAINGSR